MIIRYGDQAAAAVHRAVALAARQARAQAGPGRPRGLAGLPGACRWHRDRPGGVPLPGSGSHGYGRRAVTVPVTFTESR